jgi:hypothetical protein
MRGLFLAAVLLATTSFAPAGSDRVAARHIDPDPVAFIDSMAAYVSCYADELGVPIESDFMVDVQFSTRNWAWTKRDEGPVDEFDFTITFAEALANQPVWFQKAVAIHEVFHALLWRAATPIWETDPAWVKTWEENLIDDIEAHAALTALCDIPS